MAGDSATGEQAQIFRATRPELLEQTGPDGMLTLTSDDVILRDSDRGVVVDFRPAAYPALIDLLALPTSWDPRDSSGSWAPVRGSKDSRHLATASADRLMMGRDVRVVATYQRSTADKRWNLRRVQLSADAPSAPCSGPRAPWRTPASDATAWANSSPDVRAAIADGWTLQTTLLALPEHPATASVRVRGHDTVRVLSQGVSAHTVRFSRPELHSEAAVRLERGAGPGYVSAYGRVLIERIEVQLASDSFGAVGAVLVKKGSHQHDVVLDDLRAVDHPVVDTNEPDYTRLQRLRDDDIRKIERAVSEANAVLRARPHYEAQWAINTLGQTSRELAALSRTLSAHLLRAQSLANTGGCTDIGRDLIAQDAFVVRIAAGFEDIDNKLDDFASHRVPTSQATIDRHAARLRVMLIELTEASSAFAAVPLDSCGGGEVRRTP